VVKQNDNEVAESKIMIFGSIAITTNLTITKNLMMPVLYCITAYNLECKQAMCHKKGLSQLP
jgi:hypothetical protein